MIGSECGERTRELMCSRGLGGSFGTNSDCVHIHCVIIQGKQKIASVGEEEMMGERELGKRGVKEREGLGKERGSRERGRGDVREG